MADIFIEEFRNIKFTKNQQNIARYFSEHAYDIVRMSLTETAAAAGVSEVTILNFVRKLGYKGFVDFKDSVVDRLEKNANAVTSMENSSLSMRLSKNLENRDDRTLLENHTLSIISAAESSLLQNSAEAYRNAADLIAKADKVFITGARSMIGIAERYGRGLDYLVDNVYILREEANSVIRRVARADNKDTLILICFSRFYKSDIAVCKAAKDSGVKIVLITDTSVSPLSQYADVLLVADSKSISFYNSTIGAVAIMEYLIALIADEKGESLKANLDSTDKYTEDFRL